MDRRSEFLESINVKNDLKYRYYTLDRKIQNYINETLENNGTTKLEEMTLIEKLSYMVNIYQNKRDIIMEILNIYYSDMILTENSYDMLKDLYSRLREDTK